MRHLKTFILCLLLLAIPFKGFAAARMIFCGGHGDALHPQEVLHEHGTQHGTPHPSSTAGDHQANHEPATELSEGTGCWDCYCSVCAVCCTAAGMTPSNSLSGSVLEPSRSRPFSTFSNFKGRIPATLDRPPLAPRSARVA